MLGYLGCVALVKDKLNPDIGSSLPQVQIGTSIFLLMVPSQIVARNISELWRRTPLTFLVQTLLGFRRRVNRWPDFCHYAGYPLI